MDNNMNGGQGMNTMPMARQLNTNRGLLKFILLSLVTFGIYSIIFYSSLGEDLNLIASRYDGKKSMHYCIIVFLLTPITLGIAALVWVNNVCNRIGRELQRRGINVKFDASTFWLWGVLGSFIVVGPFVFMAKLCKAMNELCQNYNANGI